MNPIAINRRIVLKSGGALLLSAVIPLAGCGGHSPDRPATSTAGNTQPPNPTKSASFLDDKQRDTLSAFVDRLIPADTDPGAVIANCTGFIDAYLAAFLTTPAFIFAGAAFSDRGGNPTNDFLEFIPLDPYEELAWRIVIEGSQGLAEREFNGPIKGLQQIYTEGLAQLNTRAADQGAACFSELSAAQRDIIINDSSDALVQELLDVAFLDTLNGMYGAPEYQGNQNLAGWGFTQYDGDVQPRGFTDEQVINADNPGPLDATLPPSFSEIASNKAAPLTPNTTMPNITPKAAQLAALASPDGMAALMAACNGKVSLLREQMKHLREVAHHA